MKRITILKVLVFLACLIPLGRLAWKGVNGMLGANPIEVITRSTGTWVLIFLMITLGITPVRRLTGWHALIRFRRMTGLFAFFYGCLHLTTYVWLDKFFDFRDMAKDIGMRPFITMGMTAFALMLPLALTSTQGWIRRLGKRWQQLHRLIYLSAIAGVIHFWWQVKADTRKPAIFATILTALLLFRMLAWLVKRRRTAVSRAPSARPQPAAAD